MDNRNTKKNNIENKNNKYKYLTPIGIERIGKNISSCEAQKLYYEAELTWTKTARGSFL